MRKKLTLKDMYNFAEKRNIICLSKTYINAKTPLKWGCKHNPNHIWEASYDYINRQFQSCPTCTFSRGVKERLCRAFFENIFNEKFPSKRLRWLVNNRGNIMVLDGYCENLSLAFEYNGRQHYEKTHWYDHEGLKQRKEDDKLKKKLCKGMNITFIEVPYTVKVKNMQNFIVGECEKYGIEVPNKKKLDPDSFEIGFLEGLNDMQTWAKKQGGECLSKDYLGAFVRLEFRCKRGHIFHAMPTNIRRGKWCKDCAHAELGKSKRTPIEVIIKKLDSKGYKLLSGEYENEDSILKISCGKGHNPWETKAYNIMRGTGCPVCGYKETAKKKIRGIKHVRAIGKTRKFELLSIAYSGCYGRYKWQCNKGHEWEDIYSHIKEGRGCPECRKERV